MSEDASYADMNGNEESKPRITGIRSVNNLYKLPMGEGAFVNKVIICCECKKELVTACPSIPPLKTTGKRKRK
jgi:hypothetical protein